MVNAKSYPINHILQDTAAARGVLARLWPVVRLPAGTAPAAQSFGSIDYSDSNGRARVINSDDGNAYCKGSLLLTTPGNQLINATTGALVTGLQVSVSASTYYINGCISWVQGATASAQNFWFNGPSATYVNVPYFFAQEGSGVSNGVFKATKIGSGGGASIVSPAFSAGVTVDLYFQGPIQFSASGTFGFTADEGNAGDPFTIQSHSFMMISPT